MAIKASVAASPANSWVRGKFIGFKATKSGDGYLANFKLATGDLVNKLFGQQLNVGEINELRLAVGLPAAMSLDEIMLPEVGDEDMGGYDTPLEIFVTQRGKFMNAGRFRQIGAQQPGSDTPSALAGGEDDLPF